MVLFIFNFTILWKGKANYPHFMDELTVALKGKKKSFGGAKPRA